MDLQQTTKPANAAAEQALLKLLETIDPSQQLRDIKSALQALPGDQEFNQLRADLKDLRALISNGGKSHKSTVWKIVDTDDVEELFLCGTVVAGSCQHTNGDGTFNRALLGYVLDPKYRMTAVKNGNGITVARQMLRLLWDDCNPQSPHAVLQLERYYERAGTPAGAKDALLEAAKAKARQLGVPLVTAESIEKMADKLEIYPNPLQSLASVVPYEYVDALHGIQSESYTLHQPYSVPLC
ncbi:hypothetical protein [Noviherbaspirillum saxi]|uniref:Uncharacterized protein n=1 Tax=Noviherbaspirillum saxi TaxID=2320863 RepID=A0A3A3G166_9BURK|nr:hypothetical protein [Noviherbaspirillum saxi]RJF91813.1 hypothetical protein D3871_24325 [Noviherbaspirillum saxi]